MVLRRVSRNFGERTFDEVKVSTSLILPIQILPCHWSKFFTWIPSLTSLPHGIRLANLPPSFTLSPSDGTTRRRGICSLPRPPPPPLLELTSWDLPSGGQLPSLPPPPPLLCSDAGGRCPLPSSPPAQEVTAPPLLCFGARRAGGSH
jgi:hypothetical protein